MLFRSTVKEGHREKDYVESWKRGSSIIQESTGAEGTVLYRKIGDPCTFLAIATWKSKEVRDVAMNKLDEGGLEVREVLDKHKTHGDIEIIGNFEEIERVKPLRDN